MRDSAAIQNHTPENTGPGELCFKTCSLYLFTLGAGVTSLGAETVGMGGKGVSVSSEGTVFERVKSSIVAVFETSFWFLDLKTETTSAISEVAVTVFHRPRLAQTSEFTSSVP